MNDAKKALNIHLVKPSQIMELSSSRTPSTMRNSRQYSLRMLQIAQSLLSMAITMLSILPGLRAHVADTRYLGFLVDMHLPASKSFSLDNHARFHALSIYCCCCPSYLCNERHS